MAIVLFAPETVALRIQQQRAAVIGGKSAEALVRYSFLEARLRERALDRLRDHADIVGMADLLGTFEQVILLSVVGLGNDAYGRSVLREAQSVVSSRVVSAGAVYATLDRLENQGLLLSHLAEGGPARGGRPRRYYQLTINGASALTEARTALEKMWRGKPWPLEVFA